MTQFDPSMVAEMLMQPVGRESLSNRVADENFFQPVEIPSESMVAPLDMQGGFFKGPNTDNQDMTVEPGMLLPFERTAEGRLQFATPQLVAGILEGLQQAGQTIQKGVSGDPMFVPVDGKLSEQAIDEITNLGLTMGGTAFTGSSLIPGLVPEGSLGVFAGRKAATFPDVQLKEKMNENIAKYNNLAGELNKASLELSKGRFAMDENIYQDLKARQSELVKEVDNFIDSGAINEQSFFKEYDAKLNQSTPFSFFKETEREYGKGLFKLPDNKYRFEIDDQPAKINLNIDDSVDAFSGPKTTSFELEEIIPPSNNLKPVPSGHWIYKRDFSSDSINKWDCSINEYGDFVLPVFDIDKQTKGWITRRQQAIPKYLYSKGFKKSRSLFGIHLLPPVIDRLYVTEGALDTIWLDLHGYSSVAILGAICSPTQIDLISSLHPSEVVLCLDNDTAGQKGINNALLDMSDRFLVSYIKIPKQYKDVQDIRQATQLHKVLENKTYW